MPGMAATAGAGEGGGPMAQAATPRAAVSQPAKPQPAKPQTAKPQTAKPQSTRQYIAFELGQQFYGVEITTVREIRQWMPTAEMPDQPAYGRGVLDIRGEIIAVYDLRARLGGPMVEIADTHMVLILTIDGRSLGILVDAVTEIISIPPDELRPVPDGTGSVEPGTITNLAAHGDKMIALLNCKLLFGQQ